MTWVEQVAEAVASVLPARRPIGHHDPDLGGWEADVVRGAVLKVGRYEHVKAFEAELCRVCGVEYACVVSSGTCALQLALLAVGVRPGDEVIVPALTFAGTANAVCNVGAVPHFVDSDIFGIPPFKLERYLAVQMRRQQRRLSAIIAVHVLGIPCAIDELRNVAEGQGLFLVEDAAEALGSKLAGKPCGGLAPVSILSFNKNKIVTTDCGGAVLTNDSQVHARAFKLATTARVQHPWLIEHDAVAFNYRMGDINAALGLAQIRRLDAIVAGKRRLAAAYRRALSSVRNVELVDPDNARGRESNHWLNALVVADELQRDAVLTALHARKILARCLFTPLHRLPQFQNCPRSDKIMHMADKAWREIICLPSGPALFPAET